MNKNTSILIVDDEVAIAKALQLKFEHEGFMTDLAHDGEQALNLLGEQKYDIILLDLLMPGVDGWGVLEKIQGKGLKVVVTSNLSQTEDIERAKKFGVKDYIIKSDKSLTEIVDAVKQILK